GGPMQLQLQQRQASLPGESQVAEIDRNSLVEKTQDYLRRQCSELLKLASHSIDPQEALEKYGIDSILAMNLTNQLHKSFGSLSKTLFFEYQTIGELAKYFVESHSEQLARVLAATGNGHRRQPGVEKRGERGVQTPVRRDGGRRFIRSQQGSAVEVSNGTDA